MCSHIRKQSPSWLCSKLPLLSTETLCTHIVTLTFAKVCFLYFFLSLYFSLSLISLSFSHPSPQFSNPSGIKEIGKISILAFFPFPFSSLAGGVFSSSGEGGEGQKPIVTACFHNSSESSESKNSASLFSGSSIHNL